jgi:hypothetical protein
VAARYERQFRPGNTPLPVQRLAYANPLEAGLQAVQKFAERGAIQRGQSEAVETVLSGGTPSPKLGLTPGGLAYNQAAEKALAVRSEGVLRSKAAELASQFDGRNPTDADSFAEVYGRVADEVVQSVPEQWRAPIAFEAQTRVAEAVSAIRTQSAGFEYQKDVKAIGDGFQFDIQDAASAEQIGRGDLADAAMAKAMDKARSLVEIGAINEESAALMLREGRETIATESLYRGFLTGGVSLEAVQSGEVGAELSARARDRLVNKMEAEIAHRVTLSNRALAMQEAQVRENTRSAKVLANEVRLGIAITPEKQAMIDAMTTGAVPIDPEAFDDLRVARAGVVDSARITSAPVAAAERELAAVEALGLSTAADAERVKNARKTLEAHRAGLTGNDPVQYLAGIGALSAGAAPGQESPPAPVDFSSPDALAATLADRVPRVAVASRQYGQPLPSLTRAEVVGLRARLDAAGVDERVALLKTIATTDPQADRTLGMLAGEGGGNYAAVGVTAARVGEGVARDIAAASLIDPKQKAVVMKPAGGASTLVPDFESEAGSLMREDPAERAAWMQAASDLYAARAFRRGLTEYDPEEFKQAVRDSIGGTQRVTTGSLATFGGTESVVPAPAGVDWQARIDGLTGADIEAMGGTNLNLPPEDVAALIRQTGSFSYADGGLGVNVELAGGVVRLAMPDGRTPFRLRP